MTSNLQNLLLSNNQSSGRLFISTNWSKHPLGPVNEWPPTLLISLGIIFNSNHPMCIFWGEESYFFFNDGYLPIVGEEKGRWAMGEKTSVVWAEAWEEFVRPQVENSRIHLKSCWFVDQLIPILLNGKLKDAYFTYSNSPIFDHQGRAVGALTVCTETTQVVLDKIKLTQALAEAQHSRDELQREKDMRERFLSGLTHDLRTPISSAKMCAQMIKRNPNDLNQIHKISERIVSSMDRADDMIRDILDASKIKAGEILPIQLQECDLLAIAASSIEELATLHGHRFKLEGREPIEGHWDRLVIRRMIENLLVNAVKYGDPEREIKLTLKKLQDKVSIEVLNFGSPISEEEQKVIFEPFQRSSFATKVKEGWGIGLTLVKGFAKAHGGDISLKSSQAEGTCFSIFLPLDSMPYLK